MFILLALASAATYGAADFLGGLASRRAGTIAIVVLSQLAGLIALVLMLPFLPASTPARGDWLWGAAAGCGACRRSDGGPGDQDRSI